MILALMLLAGMPDWVPVHWGSSEPRSLDLLAGTVINCVLVDSGKLNPEFLKRAQEREIAVVAVLRSPAIAAIPQHVNAIALEGDFDLRDAAVPIIQLPSRQKIRLDTRDPIAGTSQGLWPGIVIEHGGKVMAGPTSSPWVNTNSGFLRFLGASIESAIWIGASPPADTVVPVERYGIAIADAAVGGARWIITLDDELQTRLLNFDPRAIADWKRICEYAKYFEAHREWRDFKPFSRMALAQDTDSGGLLSAGLLDLMYAQHLSARALPANRVTAANLNGLRIVINVTPSDRLSAKEHEALAEFVRSGGTLIDAPEKWRFGPDKPGSIVPSKRQLDRIQEIWEMLYNATARKNFGARTFNTAGILFNVLESADGNRLLIHVVNYTQYRADSITVQALGTWKRARLYQPGAEAQELPVYAVKDGTGIDLDKLDVLATLILE